MLELVMRCVLPLNWSTVVVHKTVLKEFLPKTNDKTLNAGHQVPQPRNIEITNLHKNLNHRIFLQNL